MSLSITKSKVDSNIYFKVNGRRLVMLLLYFDDPFLKGEDKLIIDTKRILSIELEIKYLGMMHYFLGMEVWKNANGIFFGQGKYAVDILKRCGMLDCKVIATPMESNLKLLCDASLDSVDATMYRQMIGSLTYLMNTILDICFAMNTLIQFLTGPRHVHLVVAKHVVMYLKGKAEYGIKCDMNQKTNLHDYVDSYWAGSTNHRKNTLGCFFNLRSGMIY